MYIDYSVNLDESFSHLIPLLKSGGLLGRLFSDEGVPEGYLTPPLGTGSALLSGVDLLVTATVAGSGIAVPPPLTLLYAGTGNCLQIEDKKFLVNFRFPIKKIS